MAHGHSEEIKNPGPYAVPGSLNTAMLVLAAIGIAAFAYGLMSNPTRAWAAFVQNHFYFFGIAICGAFFASVQWLVGAMWSAPVRRLMEALTAYLPVALVGIVVLFFGIHTLYHWSHPEAVATDVILKGKAGYLNTPFFMIRNVLGIGLLIFLARKLIGNSLAQDKDKDYRWTAKNRALSPGFLILFALLFTMASFDQLMSLDPHWFSTMFGVYAFAGSFYAMLALTTLMAMHFRGRGPLAHIVNDNHIHDLGKFMFGMTVFWAYIAFSQFMLIWYANLPEETPWFLTRMHGQWFYVACFLAFGKFMVPFFLLLPRDAKRDVKMLTIVGVFMLIAHWIDFLWVVQPNFFKEGPVFGLIEIGVALGFVGIFGFMVLRFLGRNNLVAIGDPRLEEAVYHHHQ